MTLLLNPSENGGITLEKSITETSIKRPSNLAKGLTLCSDEMIL